MTERRATDPYETRLAGRIRAYTDPATERRIDALATARTAMSSPRATGRSHDRPGAGLVGRRFADARWAAVFVAIALIGVVGIGMLGRLSASVLGPQPTASPAASAGGPIPDTLRHSWARPTAVTPGLDKWGSGFLNLASSPIGFGTEPGAGASQAAIMAGGPDSIVITATIETGGCPVGAVGTYQWSVDGANTVLTLTPIGADACPERQKALAGQWVRADLAGPFGGGTVLLPGTQVTSIFDPIGDPAAPMRVSFMVPAGWNVIDDSPSVFVIHALADSPAAGQAGPESFVALLANPRLTAELAPGAACGPAVGDAPGVGGSLDELVAAIVARPGVVATEPAGVTIGGHRGQLLDLGLAPSWTGACVGPGGPEVGLGLLHAAGSATGPLVGLGPEHPLRLILVDVGDGRTMAIAIFDIGPSQPARYEAHVAAAMPIVESFEFHPRAP